MRSSQRSTEDEIKEQKCWDISEVNWTVLSTSKLFHRSGNPTAAVALGVNISQRTDVKLGEKFVTRRGSDTQQQGGLVGTIVR